MSIDGTPIASMSRNDRARLRRHSVGYVCQDFNLLAGLSALENVSLPLELDGMNLKRAQVLALDALAQFDMAERADRFPDELSGGERQRVAIAPSSASAACSSPTNPPARSTRSTARR